MKYDLGKVTVCITRMASTILAGLATIPLNLNAQIETDAQIECPACTEWNRSQEPFRIFGNTYYVGTAGLSAILIAGNDGLVLIDGALPQSVNLIDTNIRKLGYRTTDIKLILNSHTHFDHAGGLAALQRASGAIVAASPDAAAALRQGGPTNDDPQFNIGNNGFPQVSNVQEINDGETLEVGDIQVTAYFTPGHTPGGTTWSWQSCENGRCLDLVYVDSLNAVSADSFRFSGDETTPSIVGEFKNSIRIVEALPCDIFLSPHPGFFKMQEKLRRRSADETDVFVDREGCRAYARYAMGYLESRVEEEKSSEN